MKALRANTATELFALACDHLRAEGVETHRGTTRMIEAPGPVTLTLDCPEQHMVLDPVRRINPWVSLAEFPWMIAGRNDVAWLRWYLPRAIEFSDNGKNWRAAYGPRLRRYGGAPSMMGDQLLHITDELRKPGLSRRAVATLWIPGTDWVADSFDYPCTNWLSFQHRPGSMDVDLTVAMRSNDLWWGWSGVNVVNWSLLLEAVCEWSGGLAAGAYHHVADNLHVYADRHGAALQEVGTFSPDITLDVNRFRGGMREFTVAAMGALHDIEARRGVTAGALYPEPEREGDWLSDWAFFMGLHGLRDQPDELLAAMTRGFGSRRYDWQRAAMQWALKGEWK